MEVLIFKLIPYALIIFCLYAGIRAIRKKEFGMRAYGTHDIAKGKSAIFFGIFLVSFALLLIFLILFDIDPSNNPYLQ